MPRCRKNFPKLIADQFQDLQCLHAFAGHHVAVKKSSLVTLLKLSTYLLHVGWKLLDSGMGKLIRFKVETHNLPIQWL